MTVQIYRYDDASAPVLSSPTVGSLIALLDACLVNGYGSKSPAGWTKAFSGTNLAAYRQGGGSMCYLRIDNSTGTAQARAVGYESMTDVSTGTNPFPTATQLSGGVYINMHTVATAINKPWVIIADEKRFYLWTGYTTTMTSASLLSDSTTYQGMFFFGDVVSYKTGDAFCCQIIGANTATTNTERFALLTDPGTASLGHYIARDAAQAALSVQNSKSGDYHGSNSVAAIGVATSFAYPDPISGGLNLARIRVSNGATIPGLRGHLPGAWAPLNALPGNNGDTFSGVGELAGKTFILLDCGSGSTRGRVAIETSNTWEA